MKRYILCYPMGSQVGTGELVTPRPDMEHSFAGAQPPGKAAVAAGAAPAASRTAAASALGTCTLALTFGGSSTR